MAFPSTNRQESLAAALAKVQSQAANIKSFSIKSRDFMAGNTVSANQILQVLNELKNAKAIFDAVSTIPGIGIYAQEQLNDGTLNIVAEFTTMTDVMIVAMDWVVDTFPKDGSGYLLKDKFNAYGLDVRQFTPVQTAGLQTALSGVVASID